MGFQRYFINKKKLFYNKLYFKNKIIYKLKILMIAVNTLILLKNIIIRIMFNLLNFIIIIIINIYI